MWSHSRNYWKESSGQQHEIDEGEEEHSHCNECYKIRCQYKCKKSCGLMHCPLLCGAIFHSCKSSEHKELCSKEIVPCVNAVYGCKQSMRRSERGPHLATCPASVVYCTMEWNRWPVFSRERQERVPFAQKNLHARYGQLDVALAMRDQRILYEAMKAPRRVRRSLRNRLTERFPAVPLTSSHSSYIEGDAVGGLLSDEDAGGDAPWDLSKDPPGLQRSICKELFKTDSGSLHLDALDAQVRERNGSEGADRSAHEGSLCRNGSRTNSCSGFDQKEMVATSVKHFQGCDMGGLPVFEGHVCSCSTLPMTVSVDVKGSNTSEFALVDKLPNADGASEVYSTVNERLERKMIVNSHETDFPSEDTVFVSSLTVKAISQNEGVADVEEDMKIVHAVGDKISRDSDLSFVHASASEGICSNNEEVKVIIAADDVLEGRVSSADVTFESGYVENRNECNDCKVSFVESNCDKLKPTVQASDTLCMADQVVATTSSMENVTSPIQLNKLAVDSTISNVDLTTTPSSHLLCNFSSNTVHSEARAALDATSNQHDVLFNPPVKAISLEDRSSKSIENSVPAVSASGEASFNSHRLSTAEKAEDGSESPHPGSNDCQGMTAADTAVESLGFLPDLVFLGIDVASVSNLHHHNAVVFLPPTGGTIANPGTVLVDLPKEYHNMVEGGSIPPPIPPPLTLQEILALDLNLESITRYQAKPRSMYTFLCAQNFRRDEYPWHFKNVHSEIHGGLNGWIEARCPLACYGCTYSTRRLNPVNCTVLYNSEVDCFGVRPNLPHCKSMGELPEGPSEVPSRAQKEATPEIYTSKDYDSAVNIKCRSYAKEDEALKGEASSQASSTGVIAQSTDAITEMHEPNNDHDIFPPPHDLSKLNAGGTDIIFERCNKITETQNYVLSDSNLSSDIVPSVSSQAAYAITKDKPGGASFDSMSSSSHSATVKGVDESLLLRMLPFEVLQHIARRLDSFSLCNLAMTSHFLREVCRSIVEHRGIVIQEWEKKEFDSGSSWQVTYQRWLFSNAFTPCEEWRFEESPSISEHLKVCPFNVMAEPRSQPFQLCCLSLAEDYYRNHEAEEKLERMYPGFDPKSIHCPDNSSRMPGAEVLDHLYVNEIGKSGFSGYKRALKSFALSCSEQLRDTMEHTLGIKTVDQFGELLEPEMAIETSDSSEPHLEASASVQSEDYYLEPKLATKSSEQFGNYPEPEHGIENVELFVEPKLATIISEKFGEPLELKLESKPSEQFVTYLEPKLVVNTSELFEDRLVPKLDSTISEQFGESTGSKPEQSAEQFEDYLEPKLGTNTSQFFDDSLGPKLETLISDPSGESKEQKVETESSELFEDHLETKLEANTSEHFGDSMEQSLEPKS